jgi:5-methylcytosine-specific restriction enzyme A
VLPAPKKAAAFYLTPQWRGLISHLIGIRGRICEKCGRTRADDGAPIRIYGDHIIELKDGGALLDPSGIQLLCPSCHTAKTVAERKKRYA